MRPLVACLVGIVVASFHSLSAADDPCPIGMKLVDGEYCPQIQSTCLVWLDSPGSSVMRCKEYSPSSCAAKTRPMAFCIDTTEMTEEHYARIQASDHPVKSIHQVVDSKSRLPLTNITFYQAEALCEAEGKTLCGEEQWEMACEGPAYNNYPTGQQRRCDLCNCDRTENVGPDFEHRVDHRETVDQVSECRSGYGVEAMVGNSDEWVRRTKTTAPYISVLHGGHWLPIRARCSPDATTTGHGPTFSSLEVGARCCSDVRKTQ